MLGFLKSLMINNHLSINEVMDSDWQMLLSVLGAGAKGASYENEAVDLADFITNL